MDNSEQTKGNFADEKIFGTENEKAESEKEQMDEMPSSMNNESALAKIGNPRKEKAKKRANLSPYVLDEVLAWIKRTELAQSSLSTSSLTFHQYCWPYLHGWKVKPRIVRDLSFSHEHEDAIKFQNILKKDEKHVIPIAQKNPPEYINGFEFIEFRFIDNRALQFMQAIMSKLKAVEIRYYSNNGNKPKNGLIHQLMTMLAPITRKLVICETDLNNLNKFNKHYPGFINDIQSIRVLILTETVVDLVMKWLNASRDDGKTKTLEIYSEDPASCQILELDLLIDCVKEEFVNSNEPANFIIHMEL